ncbi:MAG TPA: hypothetical protein VLJ37_07665 [bacterium]|nr:hypothetical protein [bacterium]
MNWRVHAISFALLLFAVGALKLVWDNPKIILFVILGVIAVLAYGAIYIIVKAKMEHKDDQRGK